MFDWRNDRRLIEYDRDVVPGCACRSGDEVIQEFSASGLFEMFDRESGVLGWW